MTPLRLILALIFASLFSQFPAFTNQYELLLRAEIATLDRIAKREEPKASDQVAKAELAKEIVAPKAEVRAQINKRLTELQPELKGLQDTKPVERLLHPQYMSDPSLLRLTWDKFKPSLPIGPNGLISAVIGFVLGWAIALLFGLIGRKRPTTA